MRREMLRAYSCVSGFHLDLRMAFGLLDEALDEFCTGWPESVEDAAAPTGPSFSMLTADPWLAAFVVGRLAGLRDTRHDGTTQADRAPGLMGQV